MKLPLLELTNNAGTCRQARDEGGEDGDDDVKDTLQGLFGTFFHIS